MHKIHGRDIKEIVADGTWQALRASFVGTWKKSPTLNVGRLVAYVGDGTDKWRVARVYNYLTGTAFRTRVISHPDIDTFLTEVKRYHAYHKERRCDTDA